MIYEDICDIMFAINITCIPIRYDWIKYVEMKMHFIKEKLERGLGCSLYVSMAINSLTYLSKCIEAQSLNYLKQFLNGRSPQSNLRASVESIRAIDSCAK